MEQQQISQPQQSSNWKKIALITFLVFVVVVAIIIGVLYGTGVVGKSSNVTSNEITKNSGLFLVGIVTPNKFGIIVPILISQKQSDNTGIAGTWASVGAKMGITPVFDEITNTYRLSISKDTLKYVQTISFVSSDSFDIVPGANASAVKMCTYLVMGSAKNGNMCLYTIGKGACSDISKYDVIHENPLGYDDLKNLAFESLTAQGFCTPNNTPSRCIPEIPSSINK